MYRLLLKFAFLLAVISAKPLYALSSDSNDIVHVEADSASISQLEHRGIYQGHVGIKQGSSALSAAYAITEGNDKNQLIKAVAKGERNAQAHFSTRTSEDKPILHAYADIITYYPLKHLIVLEGHATVQQGKNSFSAACIRYDTLKKHIVSESKGSRRTTIIIYPEKKLS